LKEGSVGTARMSMDTYITFPIRNMADWKELKKRYNPTATERYEPYWNIFRVEGWRNRHHPLIFGENCTTLGLYWYLRELIGTEPLSYAFYDQPDPLISPSLYKKFLFPRYKRVIDFYKTHGVKYICVDTDGNPEALIPMMLDEGVDALWPLERASDMDPVRLRKKFGKALRLWGGVDKRVLSTSPEAIKAHLKTMSPLIKEGGFIPTVDHTVQPDVSWRNFQYYMKYKEMLLKGDL
jgi:hypothetical protein